MPADVQKNFFCTHLEAIDFTSFCPLELSFELWQAYGWGKRSFYQSFDIGPRPGEKSPKPGPDQPKLQNRPETAIIWFSLVFPDKAPFQQQF